MWLKPDACFRTSVWETYVGEHTIHVNSSPLQCVMCMCTAVCECAMWMCESLLSPRHLTPLKQQMMSEPPSMCEAVPPPRCVIHYPLRIIHYPLRKQAAGKTHLRESCTDVLVGGHTSRHHQVPAMRVRKYRNRRVGGKRLRGERGGGGLHGSWPGG